MQRFVPNTVLYNRMLLKEEVSFDVQKGQQVWTIQDQQTGQALIARFYIDGRVEWFNDNRPLAASQPTDYQPVQNTKPVAVPTVQKANSAPAGKRVTAFLVVLLVLGGLGAGYFYQKPLLDYVQSFRSSTRTTSDPLPLKTTGDSTAMTGYRPNSVPGFELQSDEATTFAADTTVTMSDSTAVMSEGPVVAQPVTPAISPRQAVRLLNLLGQIPSEKHLAIFADARQAFGELRLTPSQDSYVDSLYTICAGRGAQSLLIHQQNGDPVSRKYAIEWYQLAYTLKPSTALQGRLNRLKNVSQNRSARRSATPKKPRESLFFSDPEVNQ